MLSKSPSHRASVGASCTLESLTTVSALLPLQSGATTGVGRGTMAETAQVHSCRSEKKLMMTLEGQLQFPSLHQDTQ